MTLHEFISFTAGKQSTLGSAGKVYVLEDREEDFVYKVTSSDATTSHSTGVVMHLGSSPVVGRPRVKVDLDLEPEAAHESLLKVLDQRSEYAVKSYCNGHVFFFTNRTLLEDPSWWPNHGAKPYLEMSLNQFMLEIRQREQFGIDVNTSKDRSLFGSQSPEEPIHFMAKPGCIRDILAQVVSDSSKSNQFKFWRLRGVTRLNEDPNAEFGEFLPEQWVIHPTGYLTLERIRKNPLTENRNESE